MKNAFFSRPFTADISRKARLPRAAFFAAAVSLGTFPAHAATTLITPGELASRYDITVDGSTHEVAYGSRVYRSADQEAVRISAKSITLDIQGLLENTHTGEDARAIRTHNNGSSRGVMTISIGSAGNANACVSSVGSDAIQLRDYTAATIHNYGTIQAVWNGGNAGQAIDLDKKMDNNPAGTAIIYNYSSGKILAVSQEAIKAGGGTTIINAGLIQTSTLAQGSAHLSSAISAKEDGATPRRENLAVENAVTGKILGGKHGITGEGVATITNLGLIEGFNGSGLNWDLVPGDAPYTVTITNGSAPGDTFAVIRGGLEHATTAADADGDGIDLDSLGDITNHGLIESTRSNRSSDGISLGGGSIVNRGGVIRSSNSNLAAATTNGTSVYGINVTGVDGARATTFAALTLTNEGGLIEALGANATGIKINGTLDDVIENKPSASGTPGVISADGIAILTIYDDDLSDSDATDTGSKQITNRSGALITARGTHAIKMGKGAHTITNEAGATIETTTAEAIATIYLVNGGTIANAGRILANDAAADAILLGGDTGGTVNITGDAAEIRGNITGSGAGQHTVNFAPGLGNFHAYTGTLNAIANINIQSGEVALSQVVGAERIEVSPGAGLLMDSAPESAELALNGTFTLTLDADDTLFSVLTGGGDFTKTGDGTLTLSETSDAYTGTLVLVGGGLEIDNGAELGDPANGGGLVVGSGTAAGISGTLNGGLVFSNAGTSALVQLRRGEINANASGEAVIFDSSDGTLKITSHQGNVNGDIVARNASAGLVEADLGSRFGALNEFLFDGNILAEDSATIALDVVSGALHLSGTGSNYAGTTTVRDGAALYADNAAGSATGVSRVLVENGGVLAGTGKISGDGNNNGILISGIISPGATEGGADELTFDGATRFTNATLAVDIAPGAHDTLVINDTLTLSGTANKVRVNAGAPLGVHDIVTASSISGYAQDSFEKITGTAPDGYSLTRGSGVVLDETATPTLRLVLSTDDALELTWTGATDATWINAPTAANWTSADGLETQYRDGDSVIFSDTGAGTVEVDGAGVAPSAMTFTHGGGSVYFLTGGDIGTSSSPAALALSGGGDVTFDNGMLYLGRVTVTDGALAFTDNAQVRLHDAAGIELSGGTIFTNAGVIQNRITGDGDGLRLVAGAWEKVSVVNEADASIRGAGNGSGVNIQHVNAEIENSGALRSSAGAGVRMEGGGETLWLLNKAGAEIIGATGGIHVSGGNAEITNRGTITADSGPAVFLGAGESSFSVLGDVATVTGDIVSDGAGAKTLLLKPSGRFGAVGRFDYADKISGHFAKVEIGGSGVVNLGEASDYTGLTTVGDGATLIVSNTSGSATGASTVVVESGGTLAGTGTVSGSGPALPGGGAGVRILGTLAPGDGTAGNVGTLTFGGDVLLDNATLWLDLLTPENHDTIAVNGAVHMEGLTSVNYSLNVFGTFDILTASGGITGELVFAPITGSGLDGYSLARGDASGAGGLRLSEDGKTLRLVVSSEGVLELVWTGEGGNTWVNGTSQDNWFGANGAELKFRNGDHVTFSNAGAGTVEIDAAGVAPGSVRFENTAGNDYTINGSIRGNGAIVITGGGAVAFTGDNSAYTGALTLDNSSELAVSGKFNGNIDATSGSSIYNDGEISNTDGIHVGAGPGSDFYLQNTGTIAATSGPALALDGDFDGEIVNRGTMSGGGLAVRLGNGRHTLTNRGTLAATSAGGVAVLFEAGESVLNVLGDSAQIIGDITGAAGATKTLNFSPSGRASLGAPGIFSYEGNIRGEDFVVNITSGAVVLGGTASDYTGFTTVGAGATLYAVNASGSATGASRVVVESGAVLAGTGGLRGAGTAGITVNGTVAPGDTLDATTGERLAGIGTLRLDGRVLFENATLEIGIGSSGTHDLITSDGDVRFRGANTVRFQPDTLGVFDIVSADSVSLGTEDNPASFNKITGRIDGYSLTRGSGFRVSDDGARLQLVVSNSGALDLAWTGAENATWVNAPTAANWTSDDGEETQYRDGDRVTFAGNGAATVAIDTAGVAPGSVRFENTEGSARTINGTIRGNGALAVSGGGSVTLNGQNAYTGGTRVENGTLVASQENALGNGNVVVLANGRLDATAARITGDVENAGVARLANINGSVRNTGTLQLGGNAAWGALHNAGLLDFANAGRTLTVASLHGIGDATGTLRMDINLNEPALSDKLIVQGALIGKHHLVLTDVSPNQNAITHESGQTVKLIEAPNANFSDATVDGQLVTDLYVFPVVADATRKIYILGTANDGSSGPQISPGIQAVVNTSAALTFAWFGQLDNLNKRMGELHFRGATAQNNPEDSPQGLRDFWIRAHGQHVKTDLGMERFADFSETQYGADVGFDQRYAVSDEMLVYIGVFLGYQGARRSFNDGFSGTGSTDSFGGGFYATISHRDGWYLDAAIKAQVFQNKYDIKQLGLHGSFENTAAGISIEGGKRVDFGDAWFVEPSLQLAFAHVFANDYTTRHGLAVSLEDADVMRLGASMRLGRVFTLAGGGWIQPSLRLGVEHQNGQNGGVTLANGTEHFSPDIDGWQINLGLGISWQLDATQQVYFNYDASFGDKYEKPWGISLGYRKNF